MINLMAYFTPSNIGHYSHKVIIVTCKLFHSLMWKKPFLILYQMKCLGSEV